MTKISNADSSPYAEAAEETRDIESVFREGIEVVSEGFSIYDRDDRLIACNEAYKNIYGTSRDLIVPGAAFEEIVRAGATRGQYPAAAGRVDEWVRERVQQHRNANGRAIEQHLDDGRCLQITEHKTPSGYIVGSRIDITAIKRAEEEKRQMLSELDRSARWQSVGQLAAGIAHEINTPVQYIGDNLHFLQETFEDLKEIFRFYRDMADAPAEGPGTANAKARIGAILEKIDFDFVEAEIPEAISQALVGTQQVNAIVTAMKDFAYQPNRQKAEANLAEVIDNAATISRNEWKYAADLSADVDPDLPPVNCYRGELSQVVLNLIVNAAHAIADKAALGPSGTDVKGRIEVSARQVGDAAEIRITDNSGGIPVEIQDRVFLPFFTTKEVGRGTGQGLAISYDIVVNKHGGSLAFETAPGQGTTFVVRVPMDGRS